MTLIHILDHHNDTILGDSSTFYNENHVEKLEEETFSFMEPQESEIAPYLNDKNRVIIPVDDGFFREFIINEVVGKNEKEVYCTASYIELKNAEPIAPTTLTGATVNSTMDYLLQDTGWQRGTTDYVGSRTVVIEDYINPYQGLKQISNADTFNLELRFRIDITNGKITRLVDMVEKIGEWRGREIESGKDLISAERRETTSDVVTALYALGPEKEDGSREVVIVRNEEARQIWGRKGKHLWDIYEPESTDQDMTRERLTTLGENELQKRISAKIQYVVEGADIEQILGREHEKIRLGDTVRIKATEYNPPIYLDSRVIAREGGIKNKSQKKYTLGEFIEYTEDQIRAVWKSLQSELRRTLSKLIVTSVSSTAGDVFKNGTGTTELTAEVFLSGALVDKDGSIYDYVWSKRDKDGNPVSDWNKTGKSITITADEIDEKAEFIVDILQDTTLSIGRITITNVFDGEQGPQGPKGEKGEQGPAGESGRNLFALVNVEGNTYKNANVTSVDSYKFRGNPNTEYTLSTDIPIRNNTNYDLFFDPYPSFPSSSRNGVAINEPRTVETDSTGLLEISFRPSSSNDPNIDDILSGIYHVKLGKGNVASDWMSAPEDVQKEIDDAKSQADKAQQTADGKNTVFYQDTQPPTTGRSTGDIWFDTDNDYMMYRWTGSVWSSAKFGNNAIFELDAAKINTGYLNSGRIATGSITADKIDLNTLNGKIVNGLVINGGEIKSTDGQGREIEIINSFFASRFDDKYLNISGASLLMGNTTENTQFEALDDDSGFFMRYTGKPFKIGGFNSTQTLGTQLKFYPDERKLEIINGDDTELGDLLARDVHVSTISGEIHHTLNLINNWIQYGNGTRVPRAIKYPHREVQLSGAVAGGLVGDYTMATLPVGMRPGATELFKTSSANGGSADIWVYPSGAIRVRYATNNIWVSLSGISFHVEG